MPGVRRLEIRELESPTFEGMEFAAVGAYERFSGRFHCDLDPAHALNRGIVNIDKAPRNAAGMVEYSVDFHLVKPRDLQHGNGWLFYEFLNRGSQRGIVRINQGSTAALPRTKADIGNAFLMREGYTLLWTAWQGNVEPGADRLLADFPIATEYGHPVTAQVLEEIVLDAPDSIRGAIVQETSPTALILTLSYPAADLDPAAASLTGRQFQGVPRRTPPGVSWKFLDERHVEIQFSPGSGLDRAAIYEFIYRAKNPVVMGLGYASVRDIITFLRTRAQDDVATPNPLFANGAVGVRRAMCFGLSQSGRVIRDFLWQGFNESPSGGAVFEAAVPIIGGSRKAWVNEAFSSPGRYSRQHEDHTYPGDQFPFGYTLQTDPISGRTDSVLARSRAAGVCPRIMHLDTDSEAWSARASLVATDCEGNDVVLPDEVRLYLAAGTPHGNYPLPSMPCTQQPTNPLTYGTTLRALLVAMREWVDNGTEPPPSQFPSRQAGTLWTVEELRAAYPRIPGVEVPHALNELRARDFSVQPPTEGSRPYPVFVPAVDSDGNSIDGIRHALMQAPLGTHAGWTIRAKDFAPGAFYSVYGSFVAFARTREEREACGDPRPSFAERYGSHEGWVRALQGACERLVAARLMLVEDARTLVAAAREFRNVFTAV